LLQKHFEITQALLWDNWWQVITIAHALLERGKLTGDEARRLLA